MEPSEVLSAALETHFGWSGRDRRAAAAIIAQHYAPVIAENERLREALRRYGDRIRMAMAPAELQQTIDDALGAKP